MTGIGVEWTPHVFDNKDFLAKLQGAVLLMGGSPDIITNKQMSFSEVVELLSSNNINFFFTLDIPNKDKLEGDI